MFTEAKRTLEMAQRISIFTNSVIAVRKEFGKKFLMECIYATECIPCLEYILDVYTELDNELTSIKDGNNFEKELKYANSSLESLNEVCNFLGREASKIDLAKIKSLVDNQKSELERLGLYDNKIVPYCKELEKLFVEEDDEWI